MTTKINRFGSQKECETWCAEQKISGQNQFMYAGPIHKHDGILYVQLYRGQHEWAAVNLADPTDIRHDPGYEATVFGWAYVDLDGSWLKITDKELPEPESSHPPITQDEILFGDKEQVESYLGIPLNQLTINRLPESDND